MKVDGQQAFFYDVFGFGKFDEATVKRESRFDLSTFSSKSHLELDAGAGDDLITVKKTGDDAYEVSVNGQKFTLTKEELEGLELKGGSGDDRIIIDASVDVDLHVDGGSGDDTIVNHASGIHVSGGSGDDLIVSTGDACDLEGGSGRDSLIVTGDGNSVRRGSDERSWFDDLFHWLGQDQDEDSVLDLGRGNVVE